MILFDILQEARRNHHDDCANGECCHDADRLQVVHGTFRKQQCNGQQNQQDAPHQLDALIGLFIILEGVVAVAGCRQCDRIKGCCVEGDHRNQNSHHNDRCAGHSLDHIYDHTVHIAVFQILGDKICLVSHLQSHGVVTQHNEAGQCRANAKHIATQNRLAYRSATGNAANKERCCHTPNHPVGPVINGPVLGEVGGAQRVGIGGKVDEILHHPSQRGKTGFDNIPGLAAKQEDKGKQPKEKIDADIGQFADTLEAMQQRVSIHDAGDQQDDDIDDCATDSNME